jgi:hypothetical protein
MHTMDGFVVAVLDHELLYVTFEQKTRRGFAVAGFLYLVSGRAPAHLCREVFTPRRMRVSTGVFQSRSGRVAESAFSTFEIV